MSNPIENPISSIQALENAIEQTSCIPADPFVILGTGSPSTIDYNLPQATCYSAIGLAKLNINITEFKDTETNPDHFIENFWATQSTKSLEAIRVELDTQVTAIPRQTLLPDAFHIRTRSAEAAADGSTIYAPKLSQRDISAEGEGEKPLIRNYNTHIDKDYLAIRIKQGYMPVPYRKFSGILGIRYIPRPISPKPRITIVLHYKMCSYLGDYGAGQTIKTFSLLPGEKMEIGIRHYLRNESIRTQTQHILDSFSTSAADDLQNMIEDEHSDSELFSSSYSYGNTHGGSIGGGLGLNIGVFSLGIDAQHSQETSTAQSMSQGAEIQTRHLAQAVTNHVSRADTLRQIDVNSESTEINISENEETIKRTLENYNKSRVLNFVFRQLLQEYFTITYLDDITFTYSNGYPQNDRSFGLSSLEANLKDLLTTPEFAVTVRNKIYKYLCSITDYTGTRIGFIEEVTETLSDSCIPSAHDTTTEEIKYVRKRNFLAEDFPSDQRQTYRGKVVNGIIVNVADRVIRTSSLVTEALLGKGEALDCYNQKLQNAAATKVHLDNLEQVQRIEIIEGITNATDKATNYKKVNGTCCENPQTQIIP